MQRRGTIFGRVCLWAALLLASGGADAVAQATSMEQGIAAEFRSLASHASTIFVGRIVAIERKGGVVEVTFRIEAPVAGQVAPVYVLREWAGLWPPGHSRYTAGQRVLAFLHSSSAAGLSSPVHGAEGLVPVVVQGANAPPLLDIRRLASAVVRSPNTPIPNEAEGGMLLSGVLTLISSRDAEATPGPLLFPLPTRGSKPVGQPRSRDPRYPVVLPAPPNRRGPLKMPVLMGDGIELP